MSAPGGRPAPPNGPADDPRHPERALAPDYVLGLLGGREQAAYEAHLAGCAECRAEVRAYAETAALLVHAAPPAAPPAGLRARILAEARRPRLVRDESGGGRRSTPGDGRPAPSPARRAPGAGARAPWLAAAASLVLAAGLGAGWARERGARRAAEQVLGARAAGLAGEAAARARMVAERDALIAALTEPGVRTARLVATGAPEPMRLTWNRRRGVVVVAAAALPAPAPGRTYQLWGIPRGGAPQSLGTFTPGADGSVRVVLRVSVAAAIDVAAVTEEPAGGSPRPTRAPFMAGEVGAE